MSGKPPHVVLGTSPGRIPDPSGGPGKLIQVRGSTQPARLWPSLPMASTTQPGEKAGVLPMSESVSGKREGFQDNATCKKKGKFIADSSQGSCHASNAVVRGQKALSPSCYPIYKVCISSW